NLEDSTAFWNNSSPSTPSTLKNGSSRIPGEGGLDFQEEVVRVPEAIGHAFDHLDAVVQIKCPAL
ncbi:hypothetical protein ACRRN4_005479, partial [Pseudomonas aeruginosa]